MQIDNCKLQIDKRRASRRGFTLVELLVAISILVILMAVGLRVMPFFSVEDRRTREAARAINVYIASARNRAMETGRPCGVMLRRLPGQPLCVVGLEQVEVPPAYAGETLDAVARLQTGPISNGVATVTAQLTPEINTDLVGDGDLVQFNCQGPLYTITARTNSSLTLQITLLPGQMLPWPNGTSSLPMPYQIIRRPTKSAASGLQLPVRAVIDLEFSGTDDHSIGATSVSPVWIMFSPTGALDRVYHGGEVHLGTEPIYLLVGKQERVPAGSAEDGLANWQDVKNLWVTLNPQTGLVITAENVPVDLTRLPAGLLPPFDSSKPEHLQWALRQARELAQGGQSIGGR